MKFLKILLIILGLIFIVILLSMILLTMNDQDVCLDIGFCKAGLELNTSNGIITVNEQTCKENNGFWIAEKQVCCFKAK